MNAMKRPFPILLAPLLAMLAVGCASAPFVQGVKAYAPAAASELKGYATADASLDTAQKADLVTAADALDAVAKSKIVTLGTVQAAWAPVRAPLEVYYGTDAKLDPNERGLRVGNLERFDKLIQAEGARWIYPGIK